MSSTADTSATRILLLAIGFLLAIASGIILGASIEDSDGAVEEQQVIEFDGDLNGTMYNDSNQPIAYGGANVTRGADKTTFYMRTGFLIDNSKWIGDYWIMRQVKNGDTSNPGYGYVPMTDSGSGNFSGAVYTAVAGDYYTFSFRLCQSKNWDDIESGTSEFSFSFSIRAATQYLYSTSITYDANGGTGAPSKTLIDTQKSETYPTGSESMTISTDIPAWEGHDFIGWSVSKSGTASIQPGSVQQIDKGEDVTIYAQWELKTSALLLKSEGDVFKTFTADWGSEVSIPTDIPSKKGFTFVGWSAKDGSETAEHFAGGKLTLKDDVTLYAVWDMDPIDYTLTFDANTGSGAPDRMVKNSKEEVCKLTVPTTVPTKKGYQCVGWSTVKNGDLEYKPGSEIGIPYAEPNETLYAVWMPVLKYTLKFDANGGTDAPEDVTGESIESSMSLRASSEEPSRAGYRFLGWSLSEAAESVDVYAGQSFKLESTEVTVYAVWEKLPVVYSLKFDANGGEGIPTANAVRTSEAAVSIVIPAGTPEWEGHMFLGWSESKTSTAAEYRAGDSVALTEEKHIGCLYAVWKEMSKFTLSFDANGGSGAPADVVGWSLEAAYDATIPTDVPVKDDCRFAGWSAAQDAAVADVQRGESYTMESAEIVLYAVWEWTTEMTFTLSFDAGEGTGAPESKSATAFAPSLTVDIPATAPVREGCAFGGWSLSDDAIAPDYVAGDRIVLTSESTTLHAVWKEIVTYTISFDANKGADAPEPVSGSSAEGSCELTVPEKEPAREGFRFLGWSVSKETVVPEISPKDVLTVTEDMTLYAIWNEVVTFTLSFDANGGEGAPGAASDSSDAGSCELTIPEKEPTRDGYQFLGWSRDSRATESEHRPGETVVTTVRAMTLYAVWQQFPAVEFTGDSEMKVVVGGTATAKVSWTPADAKVVAEGPSWMSFDAAAGTIEIDAPATADTGLMALTATADGRTETVWTLTVRVIPPEDAALVTFKGNGAEDSYVFVAQGGKLSAPSDPSLEGRSFAGWYTQDGQEYDFGSTVTGSLVLVAHWSDKEPESSVPVAWILAGLLAIGAGLIVVRRFI